MAAIFVQSDIVLLLRIIILAKFGKISCQIIKFFIQKLDSGQSVCLAAIFYIGSISAVPTNKLFLGEKRMCAKVQGDISKSEGLLWVYTRRRTRPNLLRSPR